MTANVQETNADGAFEVIGLQISLLPTGLVPELAQLNLARGLVNATAADPDAAPITGIDPDEGPLSGGNGVTITGEDFGDDPVVNVDGTDVPAGDVVVNPDGTITVTMPPGTVPGDVDVNVDNGNGPSEPITYTYVADGPSVGDDEDVPVITDVTPDEGPSSGGTTVVIEGDNFDTVTGVTIGGVSVDWQLQPDGTIAAVTPPHAPGVAELVLSSPAGDATAYFTYQDGTAAGLPRTGASVEVEVISLALLLLAVGAGLTIIAVRERRSPA